MTPRKIGATVARRHLMHCGALVARYPKQPCRGLCMQVMLAPAPAGFIEDAVRKPSWCIGRPRGHTSCAIVSAEQREGRGRRNGDLNIGGRHREMLNASRLRRLATNGVKDHSSLPG